MLRHSLYSPTLLKLDNKTSNRDRRVTRILSKSTRSTRSNSYWIRKREEKSFWLSSSQKEQKPYQSSAVVKLKNQGVNKNSTYLLMFERQLRFFISLWFHSPFRLSDTFVGREGIIERRTNARLHFHFIKLYRSGRRASVRSVGMDAP